MSKKKLACLRKNYQQYEVGDVKFFDDTIPLGLLADIHEYYKSEEVWSYNNRGWPDGDSMISFASDIMNYYVTPQTTAKSLYNDSQPSLEKAEKDFWFLKELNTAVKSATGYGDDLKLARCWANGHTYGLGDSVHQDVSPADFEGLPGLTTLFYINSEWKPEWGGETFVYKSNGDMLGAIIPKPGRLMMFDPRLYHRGTAPCRMLNDLRITVALHYRIKEEKINWIK